MLLFCLPNCLLGLNPEIVCGFAVVLGLRFWEFCFAFEGVFLIVFIGLYC